ncbi:hypothetical protein BD413DRAFT_602527 [Trametes elegans]|nr:hypothetical protein BD413DRAFT_602527 [Trametes elegans]
MPPSTEKTALLDEHSHGREQVTAGRYGTLPQAEAFKGADTIQRAFVNDSVMLYCGAVDTAPLFKTRWWLRHAATYLDGVHQGRVLTVNAGEAVLLYGRPGNNAPSILYNFFFWLLTRGDTPELKKRKSEFRDKIKLMIQEAFGDGDGVNDMYELQVLGTAPEAQGRGYASALVAAVTNMAVAEGRDTFVVSASACTFYEQLGFVVVSRDVLGGDNPDWDGVPIPVHLLHRPAKVGEIPIGAGVDKLH